MFMETIRTFVAIEIPDAVKNQVAVLENQFKKIRTDIKWVHPQNIHITLKFLGNTSINRLEEIYDGLQEAVDSIAPTHQGRGRVPGLSADAAHDPSSSLIAARASATNLGVHRASNSPGLRARVQASSGVIRSDSTRSISALSAVRMPTR